jgi:SAM-dependent methyltransferase
MQSSAGKLPFADASFYVVLGKQILHHLQLDVATAELARELKPGGRAIFLEPLIHNPILELYRGLTPHLRSPTEKAPSMTDMHCMSTHFSRWEHEEFILLAIAPVVIQALTKKQFGFLDRLRARLQRLDRRLVNALPWLGRYYWETVLIFEKWPK